MLTMYCNGLDNLSEVFPDKICEKIQYSAWCEWEYHLGMNNGEALDDSAESVKELHSFFTYIIPSFNKR